MLSPEIIKNYIAILKDELRPAMGCTEPISIAYAASILTDVLGGEADEISVGLSEIGRASCRERVCQLV